jgi:RNA recognition motif-containing protein
VTGHRLSVISVTDDCYSSDSAEMKNQECSTREVSSARSERCSILDFARENAVPSDNRTTVMIRNIPCRYTQEQLYKEMREYGFLFNFMYLPPARHSPGNLGYAFANFLCSDAAQRFIPEFAGHAFKQQPNSK